MSVATVDGMSDGVWRHFSRGNQRDYRIRFFSNYYKYLSSLFFRLSTESGWTLPRRNEAIHCSRLSLLLLSQFSILSFELQNHKHIQIPIQNSIIKIIRVVDCRLQWRIVNQRIIIIYYENLWMGISSRRYTHAWMTQPRRYRDNDLQTNDMTVWP